MAKTSSSSLPVQINEEVRHLSDYFQQILKLAKLEQEKSLSKEQNLKDKEKDKEKEEKEEKEKEKAIKDKMTVTREKYQIEITAVNIVNACQKLLQLSGELKHSILLHDFNSLNSSIEKRSTLLQENMQEGQIQLHSLQEELQQMIFELENVYYQKL